MRDLKSTPNTTHFLQPMILLCIYLVNNVIIYIFVNDMECMCVCIYFGLVSGNLWLFTLYKFNIMMVKTGKMRKKKMEIDVRLIRYRCSRHFKNMFISCMSICLEMIFAAVVAACSPENLQNTYGQKLKKKKGNRKSNNSTSIIVVILGPTRACEVFFFVGWYITQVKFHTCNLRFWSNLLAVLYHIKIVTAILHNNEK